MVLHSIRRPTRPSALQHVCHAFKRFKRCWIHIGCSPFRSSNRRCEKTSDQAPKNAEKRGRVVCAKNARLDLHLGSCCSACDTNTSILTATVDLILSFDQALLTLSQNLAGFNIGSSWASSPCRASVWTSFQALTRPSPANALRRTHSATIDSSGYGLRRASRRSNDRASWS